MSNNNTTTPNGSAGGAGSNVNRPKPSKFNQQELPACRPILTPRVVISVFIIVSIVFIPIGIACLVASRDAVEVVDRYDTECIPQQNRTDKLGFIWNASPAELLCTRTIRVPKRMKQPIYVYYQLDNYYQNHRRYVKSRNDEQLRDGKNTTSGCDPEDRANGAPIVPCGLIAWSLFNDTYSFSVNTAPLTVNKTGISWKSDREDKFGDNVFPRNFQNGTIQGGKKLNETIPLSQQEDLLVWMRTAALPSFRKLYGKIEQDLQANDEIVVTLENNYNVYSFNGKKKLVLSTTTWLGGKNDFLGIGYIVVGCISFFLAMCFTGVFVLMPRKAGDPTYLTWNS